MINRRPACVYMELDQQCTDICSKAGFLWHPLLKKSWFSVSLSRSRFSPVLPLFNLSSSRSAIYAYPSYHRPGSISFPQSLYSTLSHLSIFFYLPHIGHPFLPIASLPTYLLPTSYLTFLPLPHPVTRSLPPSRRCLPPPPSHPTHTPSCDLHWHGCSPFLGLSSSVFLWFFAWRGVG